MGVLIIAEVGSNHCGLLMLAKDLISLSSQAGADIVKFQAFNEEIWESKEQWEKRKEFALTQEFAQECKEFADKLGIEFMCTPFYVEAVRWLDPLVRRWKIGSADLGNEALTREIAFTGKQAFYSTGVRKAPKWYRKDWIPLICVSRYPAKVEEYCLPSQGVVEPLPWGISDHTLGSTLAVAAVARGACAIEKHVKLNEQPWSPDVDHSLGPLAFTQFVAAIRETEKLIANKERATHRLQGRRKVYE